MKAFVNALIGFLLSIVAGLLVFFVADALFVHVLQDIHALLEVSFLLGIASAITFGFWWQRRVRKLEKTYDR